MKERPVLFSGPLVKAILEGRKTQTRRVLNPQPHGGIRNRVIGKVGDPPLEDGHGRPITLKFGRPADSLWVRETWAADKVWDKQPPNKIPKGSRIWYREDFKNTFPAEAIRGKWRPSIHIPRWASRTLLEITELRIQKLQEISEEDAKAEGIKPRDLGMQNGCVSWVEPFIDLWDSLNTKRGFGWEMNPWVWAITFKRIE